MLHNSDIFEYYKSKSCLIDAPTQGAYEYEI